jgi:8-amino-7-oxononanoate synthase
MSGFLDDLRRQAADRAAAGLARGLDVRPGRADDTALDLAGNDYLGLARHPAVIEAAAAAAREYGAGARASRRRWPRSSAPRRRWSCRPATRPTWPW